MGETSFTVQVVQNAKISPGRPKNMQNTIAISLSLATLMALGTTAQAAYVPYTFSANGTISGNAELIALLGANAAARGQFAYNSAAPVLGQGADLGYEPTVTIFAGTNSSNLPFASLAGLVAGKAFSDTYGTMAVGNSYQGGTSDVLSISSDPSPKQGQNAVPTDVARQLKGFTLGDYTLNNVRLIWSGNIVSANVLPSQLPGFAGRIQFDFVRTTDPLNTANVPYPDMSVSIAGLNAQAAVPEPSSWALSALGLAALAGIARASRRRTV
jgi:hypothetical protein